MRSQFAFYKSYDDVYQELTSSQKVAFMDTLLDVHFLRVKVDDVLFEDKMLNLLWKSMQHSIKTSITGYLDNSKRKDKTDTYLGVYEENITPTVGGTVGGLNTPCLQEEEKEEEKEEGSSFTFTLKKECNISNVTKEYKDKLKVKIENEGRNLTYQDFIIGLGAKDYKYKNFWLAYLTWCKREEPRVKAEEKKVTRYV